MGSPLENRKGVISGGAAGIGRFTALRLAKDGAHVVILDKRDELASTIISEIRDAGGVADFVHCDVTSEEEVIAGFAQATAICGSIDYFVGCTAALDYGETHELELSAWQTMIDINLTSMFLTCKHALQALLASGGGSIVTVSSVAANVERVGDRAASYGVTKAGVAALTRSIAVNYAQRGIRANCLLPGAVYTDLPIVHGTPKSPADTIHAVTPPMQRMADGSEAAGAISYLLSDDASFVTGSSMVVDGGLTAL